MARMPQTKYYSQTLCVCVCGIVWVCVCVCARLDPSIHPMSARIHVAGQTPPSHHLTNHHHGTARHGTARPQQAAGSTRFCMGAAWRELGNKKNAFGHILDMVKQVRSEHWWCAVLCGLVWCGGTSPSFGAISWMV
jgi:hypothetical protein